MSKEINEKDLEWLSRHGCLEERLLCAICGEETASTTLEHNEFPLHLRGIVYCCDRECTSRIHKEASVDTKFLPPHLKPNAKYQEILDKYMSTETIPTTSATSDKASIYKNLASMATELSSIHTSLSTLLPRREELEKKFKQLLAKLGEEPDLEVLL